MWTPLAISGDCCSIATKRFNVLQSNPDVRIIYIEFRIYTLDLFFWCNLRQFCVWMGWNLLNSKCKSLDESTHPSMNHHSRCAWRCHERPSDSQRWPSMWFRRTTKSFQSWRRSLQRDRDENKRQFKWTLTSGGSRLRNFTLLYWFLGSVEMTFVCKVWLTKQNRRYCLKGVKGILGL